MKQTTETMLADAMRIVSKDLDDAINWVRGALRRGVALDMHKRRYINLMKKAQQYRDEAKALGLNGPLFEDKHPIPFRTGFVGHTPEQVKALEWRASA